MNGPDYNFPTELYYSKEHEWVRLQGKAALVGITDYAQKQLHEIVYVELPRKGSDIRQSQTLGTVESVKSVSDVFSPVSGKITEVNIELAESPELLNQDPYGRGWIAKINLTDLKKDSQNLLTAKQYAELIKKLEE